MRNIRQIEELEVIESIYGNDWQTEVIEHSYSCTINRNVKLFITLNALYPSEAPPIYELLAPRLDRATKRKICNQFDEIYLDNVGEPVLFQWIEKLKEIISENEDASLALKKAGRKSNEALLIESGSTRGGVSKVQLNKIFKIHHGSIIQDRKSIFQGHACRVETEADVREMMNILKENKKIAQASHNIRAYRIEKQGGVILQEYDDDGEYRAGIKVLHLLDILNLKNMMVVVTRWHGGVQLGSDRYRHISNAARQALLEAGFISGNK